MCWVLGVDQVLYLCCCQSVLMVLQVRAQGGCLGLQVNASLLVTAAFRFGTRQLRLHDCHLLNPDCLCVVCTDGMMIGKTGPDDWIICKGRVQHVLQSSMT